MKLSKQTILFFLVLVIVSTLVKIICAPQIDLSGFTAVIAVSLFSGLAMQNKKLAVFLWRLLSAQLFSFCFPILWYGKQVHAPWVIMKISVACGNLTVLVF